jgi:type II secretory pathway pseudopilin PulG
MELILVILCFAISAAICLRVFVSAQLTADRSRDLSAAVLAAENAAECWKASAGDLGKCAALLNAGENGGRLIQTFDGDWRLTDGSAKFRLLLEAQNGEASIAVTDTDGEAIFSLKARVPAGGAS